MGEQAGELQAKGARAMAVSEESLLEASRAGCWRTSQPSSSYRNASGARGTMKVP